MNLIVTLDNLQRKVRNPMARATLFAFAVAGTFAWLFGFTLSLSRVIADDLRQPRKVVTPGEEVTNEREPHVPREPIASMQPEMFVNRSNEPGLYDISIGEMYFPKSKIGRLYHGSADRGVAGEPDAWIAKVEVMILPDSVDANHADVMYLLTVAGTSGMRSWTARRDDPHRIQLQRTEKLRPQRK